MASASDPKKQAPAPKHPRYVRADKPVHDKTAVEKPVKVETKDAPVVFSDWASI